MGFDPDAYIKQNMGAKPGMGGALVPPGSGPRPMSMAPQPSPLPPPPQPPAPVATPVPQQAAPAPPPSAASSFNPDAYMSQNKIPDPTKDEPTYGKAQTALEHGANAMTFGYLPQMQAAVAPAVYAVMNKLTGHNIQPGSYTEERDAAVQRLAEEAKEHPTTQKLASLGGAVLGTAVTPFPEMKVGGGVVKGLLGAGAHGAAYGAAQGAVSNPGDEPGKVDPLQLAERGENAKSGAEVGAGAGIGGKIAQNLLGLIGRSPEALKDLAETQAFKGSGAMLRDFRTAADKGQVNKIGRYMLDNGLIKAGDSVEDVGQKSAQSRDAAGQALDAIYGKAKGALDNPVVAASRAASPDIGFNPVRDKTEILKNADEALGDAVGKKAALGRLSDHLDELGQKYGDTTLDPRKANDIKGDFDDAINYSRNPLSKEPNSETAFSSARTNLRDRISKDVDALGAASEDPDLAAKLKKANQDYGYSTQLSKIAKDRQNRESANRLFGLTDTIAGGAGAAAGAALGGRNGDMKSGAEDALVLGLLSSLANKGGRKYAPGILAEGADLASPAMRYTAAPVARALAPIVRPGILARIAAEREAMKSKDQ